jgi:hypothetical protein
VGSVCVERERERERERASERERERQRGREGGREGGRKEGRGHCMCVLYALYARCTLYGFADARIPVHGLPPTTTHPQCTHALMNTVQNAASSTTGRFRVSCSSISARCRASGGATRVCVVCVCARAWCVRSCQVSLLASLPACLPASLPACVHALSLYCSSPPSISRD